MKTGIPDMSDEIAFEYLINLLSSCRSIKNKLSSKLGFSLCFSGFFLLNFFLFDNYSRLLTSHFILLFLLILPLNVLWAVNLFKMYKAVINLLKQEFEITEFLKDFSFLLQDSSEIMESWERKHLLYKDYFFDRIDNGFYRRKKTYEVAALLWAVSILPIITFVSLRLSGLNLSDLSIGISVVYTGIISYLGFFIFFNRLKKKYH
jgi:hypothetical protein